MSIKNNIESNTDLMTFPNSNIRDCKYYTLLELAEVMKSNKRNEIMGDFPTRKGIFHLY